MKLHASLTGKLIYVKLETLYKDYESKQQRYDQIDGEDKKIDEDVKAVTQKKPEQPATAQPLENAESSKKKDS